MSRKRTLDSAAIKDELIKVKLLIGATGGALPQAASHLRREALEAIDDIIADLPA